MSNVFIGLAAVALLLCFSPLSAQEERGMRVVREPETGRDIAVYAESWAILIGINRYQNANSLSYAVADAESVRSLLIRKYGFRPDRLTLLTDEKATKKGITDAFAKMLETSTEDRVIVFFAGHGTQIDLPGGGEMGYLVPVEGMTGTKSELYSTCISMEELKNISKQIPAKHALFLVDACYGGLAAITSRALSHQTRLYIQKIAVSHARQVITAGGRGEAAVEKAEWGHSAFTKALLEGLGKELADLDGNGLITASELAAYLKPRVTLATENRQTPQFKSFTDDEGDFMFILSSSVAAKSRVEQEKQREKEEVLVSDVKPTPLIAPSGFPRSLKLFAGLNFPLDFTATATTTAGGSNPISPVLAKTGGGIGLEFAAGISKSFVVSFTGMWNSYGSDLSEFRSGFSQEVRSVQAGSYNVFWLIAGAGFNLAVSSDFRIYGLGQGGLLLGNSPEIIVTKVNDDAYTQKSVSAKAFTYGFTAGFIFDDKVDVGLRFLSGELEYAPTLEFTPASPPGSQFFGQGMFVQPTKILQVSLGYLIIF